MANEVIVRSTPWLGYRSLAGLITSGLAKRNTILVGNEESPSFPCLGKEYRPSDQLGLAKTI